MTQTCASCARWRPGKPGACRWPWPTAPEPSNPHATSADHTCRDWVSSAVYPVDIMKMDARKEKRMTRDEAIKKIHINHRVNDCGRTLGEMIVDALIALDLLKVEEPPNRAAQEAARAIEKIPVFILGGTGLAGWQNHGALSPGSAADIISKILAAGLEIVRK